MRLVQKIGQAKSAGLSWHRGWYGGNVAARGAGAAANKTANYRNPRPHLSAPKDRRYQATAAGTGLGRRPHCHYRVSPGTRQRFDEIVAEFVRRKVDVIFTSGTPPVILAKKATSSIPIVFVSVGDPMRHPCGNLFVTVLRCSDQAGGSRNYPTATPPHD